MDKFKLKKGSWAFITFSTPAHAKEAIKRGHGTELHGRELKMKLHRGPAPKGSGLGCQMTSCRVFVGNLPFEAKESDVWRLFEPCGKVLSVKLGRDKDTNDPLGYGFVIFETVLDSVVPANKAVALDGLLKIRGRALTVSAET
eukprot:TRINITY_DN27601_c0_g1_i7.p2 TRINITY_DN27601_c0_g1~~TRINITY_DN27601_c0_g1_i7.p2  ORF type:complete len:143 (+),score=32.21 TRINITY_DN27601_c0_g1_i7:398-826(+)